MERPTINEHLEELLDPKVKKKPGCYYVVNLFVPKDDEDPDNRIIGPLDWEELEEQRHLYNTVLIKNLSGNEVSWNPFVVYHYGRSFVQIE